MINHHRRHIIEAHILYIDMAPQHKATAISSLTVRMICRGVADIGGSRHLRKRDIELRYAR